MARTVAAAEVVESTDSGKEEDDDDDDEDKAGGGVNERKVVSLENVRGFMAVGWVVDTGGWVLSCLGDSKRCNVRTRNR